MLFLECGCPTFAFEHRQARWPFSVNASHVYQAGREASWANHQATNENGGRVRRRLAG